MSLRRSTLDTRTTDRSLLLAARTSALVIPLALLGVGCAPAMDSEIPADTDAFEAADKSMLPEVEPGTGSVSEPERIDWSDSGFVPAFTAADLADAELVEAGTVRYENSARYDRLSSHTGATGAAAESLLLERLAFSDPVKLSDGTLWLPQDFVKPTGCAGSIGTIEDFERCLLEPGLFDSSDPDHFEMGLRYLFVVAPELAVCTPDDEVLVCSCQDTRKASGESHKQETHTAYKEWKNSGSGEFAYFPSSVSAGADYESTGVEITYNLVVDTITCNTKVESRGTECHWFFESCDSCNATTDGDPTVESKVTGYFSPDGQGGYTYTADKEASEVCKEPGTVIDTPAPNTEKCQHWWC